MREEKCPAATPGACLGFSRSWWNNHKVSRKGWDEEVFYPTLQICPAIQNGC